jgi:tRNA pseudouridine38-40 synthase
VQGELERVLAHLVGEPVQTVCAGRTDAGVHARGQVAHVDASVWPVEVDAQRINRALPDDIRVIRVAPAPPGFDARFSALWRRYSYRVSDNGLGPDPLLRRQVLDWGRPLELDAMNEAAAALLGEHDFAAFCKPRPEATTVRTLLDLHWSRPQEADGDAVLTVRADAFCHSMVRSLVGVLLPVGDARRPVSWPGQVLAAGMRDSGVTVMPAHPLVLEEVAYPADEALAERQFTTRARRS